MRLEDWPLVQRLEQQNDLSGRSLEDALHSSENIVGSLWSIVANIQPESIYLLNKSNRVPHVQPTNFVLYSNPGRFEVVINHFRKDRSDARNSPHFHHCDFATIVLSGGYAHALYNNAGSLEQPDLSVKSLDVIGPGDGYLIEWKTFHMVLEASDDTLTLLIRGPQKYHRPTYAESDYSLGIFDEEFQLMRSVLLSAQATGGCSGGHG